MGGNERLTIRIQAQPMVITVPMPTRSHQGPRPINLNKDIPQVLRLLEHVFGKTLGPEGRHLLISGRASGHEPAFLWRFSPAASSLAKGFVWEENGRIVANATLLTTRIPGRYLVVNVAVHPQHRQRGIARQLMELLIEMVSQQNGREILLQVVKENAPAINLYHRLNFDSLGSQTTWYSHITRLNRLPDDGSRPAVTKLGRNDWQAAYELDRVSHSPLLNWPDTLPETSYRSRFWQRMIGMINGTRSETWVVQDGIQLQGLIHIQSQWGHPHLLKLRVHPEEKGQWERPLLAKATRRLPYLAHRSIRIDHPDEDTLVNHLLKQANFQSRRTLTHMRLALRD